MAFKTQMMNRWSLLYCLSAFSMSLTSFAESAETFLPEFPLRAGSSAIGLLDLPSSSQLTTVRILIFPHLGPYPVPQKRESILDQISFSSTEPCEMNGKSTKTFEFKYSEISAPIQLKCPGQTQWIRESSLKSYLYSGDFEVRAARTSDGKNKIEVINILPFEEYLRGVVPAEVPATWPAETLNAQAVAARTYAVWEILAERAKGDLDYDMDDTVNYQAYLGLSYAHPATDAAILATAGKIMTYAGVPIKSYFSADSGGYVEDDVNVWPAADLPYCVSKPEVYDPALLDIVWTIDLSKTAILQKLESDGIITARQLRSGLRELKVGSRLKSGRAKMIQLVFNNRSKRGVDANRFRYLMKLRSTLFDVTPLQTGDLRFRGKGYGHGVGMSQNGSKVLAESLKWNFEQILKFYYEGIEFSDLK